MISVAMGCTGSGKTEILRRLMRRHAAKHRYRVVLVQDANNQWTPEKLARAGIKGASVTTLGSVGEVRSGKPHAKIIRFPYLLEDDLVALGELALSYHPERDRGEAAPDVAVVLDELREVCISSGFVGGKKGPWPKLLYSHRHYGVHLFAAAQSATIVDPNVAANAADLYLCHLRKRGDLRWIEDELDGECADLVRQIAPPTDEDGKQRWPLECVRYRPSASQLVSISTL